MTDLDVQVEAGQDVVVLLDAGQDLVVPVEAVAEHVVQAESVQDVLVLAEAAADVLATVEAAQEATAAMEPGHDAAVEVPMTGLVGSELDRLFAIPFPPESKGFLPIAGVVEKSIVGNGDAGDQPGDSTTWTATGSFLELPIQRVRAPALLKRGLLVFHLTAEVANPSGDGTGTETCVWELRSRPPRPTHPGTSGATFGLPQAWSAAIATITSKPIGVGAGTKRVVVHAIIAAEGVRGTTHMQTMYWFVKTKNLATGAVETNEGIEELTLDPTQDILLQWRHKFSAAPVGGQRMRTRGLHAYIAVPNPMNPY